MKRLFFALWPDSTTRQHCHELAKALRGCGRLVPANNLHVTLVFLGAVNEAQQAAITQAAASLSSEPMRLCFDRLSYWRKPAVVCLCAERVDSALICLVEQLTAIAEQQQISLDKRPYRPHVTLLRKAKSLPERDFKPIEWQASGFSLVESCSTPTGVEYRVLESWGVA